MYNAYDPAVWNLTWPRQCVASHWALRHEVFVSSGSPDRHVATRRCYQSRFAAGTFTGTGRRRWGCLSPVSVPILPIGTAITAGLIGTRSVMRVRSIWNATGQIESGIGAALSETEWDAWFWMLKQVKKWMSGTGFLYIPKHVVYVEGLGTPVGRSPTVSITHWPRPGILRSWMIYP